MNNTEREYAALLDQRKRLGQIVEWWFEPEALRLADMTSYRPDFRVLMADGLIEFHEVKACMGNGTPLFKDDARVKLKVAAELHWVYRFRGAYKLPKKLGGGWKYEEFGNG